MTAALTAFRQSAPRLTPEEYLRFHPGCFVQYFDDTPNKDPALALSADRLDPEVARRKQQAGCSVCYSLQAFQGSRTKQGLLCYRNMGVDVDLVPGELRDEAEADRRKERYLTDRLARFPLRPHWLTETAHGFHLVFRVQPVREPARVLAAETLNRRLVRALGGDPNAASLTQVFRVPGTHQFKDPARPFLCRLLSDASAAVPPYSFEQIERAVVECGGQSEPVPAETTPRPPPRLWRDGLHGVAEGQRNAVAASLVGRIVAALPQDLWVTAGWGGLKEWNARNERPLPESELRTVYDSITRRERLKPRAPSPPAAC